MSRYDRLEEVEKGIDTIEEVKKFNQNHDRLGRFSSGGGGGPMMAPDGKGGGGGLKPTDVRNFGVPGYSGAHRMNAKEKKLARQIIDSEDLDLELKDDHDAYGNANTSIHGTREDYGTFKEVWQMVAPSTLGKSIDHIDEVQKFNPYHGKDGRFSSKGGGGSTVSAAGGGDIKSRADATWSKLQPVKQEYDKLDAQWNKAREDWRKASKAKDAEGKRKAKMKMNEIGDKMDNLEPKLKKLENQWSKIENEAYNAGVNLM